LGIGYCHLEFICILVLVIWYLALFWAGGPALKSETLPTLPMVIVMSPVLKYRTVGENG
jgi:hypothetical protein